MNAPKVKSLEIYLLASVAACSFGLQPLLARFALDSCSNSTSFNVYRSLTEAILLIAIGLFVERSPPALPIAAGIGLGVLQGIALNLHIGALLFAPVAPVTVCVFMYSVFVVLLESAIDRSWHRRIFWLVCLAFLGVVLCVYPGLGAGNISFVGIYLALAAAVGLTLYLFSVSRLGYPAGCTLGALIAFVSALTSLGAQFVITSPCLITTEAVQFAVVTGVCGAIGTACLLRALCRASSSLVSLILNVEIVVTVVGAHLLFAEPLGAIQILGMMLIIFAIAQSKKRNVPA